MAFVDQVRIHASAGKGGDGVVRWLHMRGKDKGGPGGGDGGRGGDAVLVGVRDLAALARYRFEKEFMAEAGGAGGGELRHGKNGGTLELPVPVGTVARVSGADFEILEEGERVTVFRGGSGGKGNAHFKSSTNQNPFEHTLGKPGGSGDIELSLKIIADAGFIGLPSAGKSSLLNALTRAKAKVGAYPFTTLEPNLAAFHGHILADIPGLIEGASAGKGLGTKFLKHIERTGFIVHLVSADRDDVVAAYREVRGELEAFGRGLSEKPELVVLSRADLVAPPVVAERAALLARAASQDPLPVSVEDPELLKRFSDRLSARLAGR